MRLKNRKVIFVLMIVLIAGVLSWASISAYTPPCPTTGPTPTATPVLDMPSLDPNTIPKFVNQLPKPDVWAPVVIKDRCGNIIREEYTVAPTQDFAQILPPGFPKTKVIAYGGNVIGPFGKPVFKRSVPGSSFELTMLRPAIIHWRNQITTPQFLPVDPTLDWANPNRFPPPCPPFLPFPPGYPQAQFPVANVNHSHGIEVTSEMDGLPDSWFTFNGIVGPEFVTNDYFLPNSNLPSAFWYHDHVLGITRLNVHSGLSGFSFLRDPKSPIEQILPKGKYEIPMIIQDRSFNKDGSIFYPRVGDVPDLHPYWRLMFNGQTNVVNGKVWPNMNVERRQYRLRILNSANQRFYRFKFSNNMPFIQIGTDGGFVETPRVLTEIRMGVTERADLLVDFSKFAPGTKIIMQNIEQLQPPIGPPPDPNTDGTVMQFTVVNSIAGTPVKLPPVLNDIPRLFQDAPNRIVVQNVDTNAAGQIITAMLDGRRFHDPPQEFPQVGSTDLWEFTNITPLDHVKHVHLIQFQLKNRQVFDAERYMADWFAINGDPPFDHPTIKLPIEPYLMGPVLAGRPEEVGWKDSIQVAAGQITRVLIRWAPVIIPEGGSRPGLNQFPFDPTGSIGYIWHCHLLEHEDNEMIRPMPVVNFRNFPDWFLNTFYNFGDKVRFGNKQYVALQPHTSSQATRPDIAPGFWRVINVVNDRVTTPNPTCPPTPAP